MPAKARSRSRCSLLRDIWRLAGRSLVAAPGMLLERLWSMSKKTSSRGLRPMPLPSARLPLLPARCVCVPSCRALPQPFRVHSPLSGLGEALRDFERSVRSWAPVRPPPPVAPAASVAARPPPPAWLPWLLGLWDYVRQKRSRLLREYVKDTSESHFNTCACATERTADALPPRRRRWPSGSTCWRASPWRSRPHRRWRPPS